MKLVKWQVQDQIVGFEMKENIKPFSAFRVEVVKAP